jgi:hypothetical protein
MQKENAVFCRDGSKTDLKNRLTMNKLTKFQFKINADGERNRCEHLERFAEVKR